MNEKIKGAGAQFSITTILVALFGAIGYQPFLTFAAEQINVKVNERMDTIEQRLDESIKAQDATNKNFERNQLQQQAQQKLTDDRFEMIMQQLQQIQQQRSN